MNEKKCATFIKWAATWENRTFAYVKIKPQNSCAVTAQLISAFVFATWIVQYLYFLNPKFQASSHLLWFPSPVCVGLGRKHRRPVFWRRGSNMMYMSSGTCSDQAIVVKIYQNISCTFQSDCMVSLNAGLARKISHYSFPRLRF